MIEFKTENDIMILMSDVSKNKPLQNTFACLEGEKYLEIKENNTNSI
jgi:hypothetical protein